MITVEQASQSFQAILSAAQDSIYRLPQYAQQASAQAIQKHVGIVEQFLKESEVQPESSSEKE